MKRNNVAKTFGIASLCLATAFSAFSGIMSFKTAGTVLAETSFGLTDMIHTSAKVETSTRSVTIKGSTSLTTTTKPCLNVTSEDAYTATFTRIFKGNTTFRFFFPKENDATSSYGDFKFRITDATDDSNYFDIVYYETGANGTSVYLKHGDQIRMSEYASSTATSTSLSKHTGYAWFKAKQADKVAITSAPTFHGIGSNNKAREGKLRLIWDGSKLGVFVNARKSGDTKDNYIALAGAFDGTTSFKSKSTWGLPLISFPNGYTVSFSSSYNEAETRDKATGVSFTQIQSNGSNFGLSFTDGTEPAPVDKTTWENGFYNYFETKSTEQVEAGKVCIGYKDTATNALYPNYSVVKAGTTYEPVVVGFDRIPGASVRIDTSENGKSGLRFITAFNPNDYEMLIQAGYVKSFGTLLAYTNKLIDGVDFTIAKYDPELKDTTEKDLLQVANGSEGGKTFEYEHQDVTYTAYSLALVGLDDYTQEYSARGYMEVQYADGTTAMIYTAFNATNNTRSLAQTAYNLIHDGAEEFASYYPNQRNIVGAYANGYNGYVYTPEEE